MKVFSLAFDLLCALVELVAALVVQPFVWVREVLAARRRMRLWRRIQDQGLREFFIDRERSRSHHKRPEQIS